MCVSRYFYGHVSITPLSLCLTRERRILWLFVDRQLPWLQTKQNQSPYVANFVMVSFDCKRYLLRNPRSQISIEQYIDMHKETHDRRDLFI